MKKKDIEVKTLLIWLCSAGLVVVLRFGNSGDLGYDLTIQFQAARNLLQGEGISIYQPMGEDFPQPLSLSVLTHFPCGFSLLAAPLIAIGASPSVVVKIVGAVATILGWWGWGRLAGAYLGEGMKHGLGWRMGGYTIAFVCPLLFTIPWHGTDIILWASVPWVLIWLVRSSGEQMFKGLRKDAAAGVVCGVCILFRYASVFLAVYAGLLILYQCRTQLSVLLRRWLAFSAGLFPALSLQIYVNYFLARHPSIPHAMDLKIGLNMVLERAWQGLAQFDTANFAFVFWLPERIKDLVAPAPAIGIGAGDGAATWQIVVTALLFSLPVMTARKAQSGGLTACWDIRSAAAGLLVGLPMFLLACQIFGAYDYVADRRYYFTLIPLVVFIIFFLAVPQSCEGGLIANLVKVGAMAYITSFVLLSLVWTMFLIIPGERGSFRRKQLMGSTWCGHWPTLRTNYEFSAARDFVVQLMRENPDALLLTNKENWFYADRDIDLSKVHRITPCQRLKTNYISGPVRVLIMVGDVGGPLEFAWYDFEGTPRLAECYQRIPNLKLLRRFPEEQIKILEALVSPGERITLLETGSY